MSKNLALTLSLIAKDAGSKVLRDAMQQTSRQAKQLEKEQQRSSESEYEHPKHWLMNTAVLRRPALFLVFVQSARFNGKSNKPRQHITG